MSSFPTFGGQGEPMQLMIGRSTPPEALAKWVLQLAGVPDPDGPELPQLALEPLTRCKEPGIWARGLAITKTSDGDIET